MKSPVKWLYSFPGLLIKSVLIVRIRALLLCLFVCCCSYSQSHKLWVLLRVFVPIGSWGPALPAHEVPDHPHGHKARERAAVHRRARGAEARDWLTREAEARHRAAHLRRCVPQLLCTEAPNVCSASCPLWPFDVSPPSHNFQSLLQSTLNDTNELPTLPLPLVSRSARATRMSNAN